MDLSSGDYRAAAHPFVQLCENLFDFTKAALTRKHVRIATLGPAGTSSEYAASYFSRNVGFDSAECILHKCYEDAARSVEQGANDLLLVANAYSAINQFYISTTLRLTTFFVLDTPPYGLAAKEERVPSLRGEKITIATHPAPAHFLPWYTRDFRIEPEVRLVQSTSEAARLAASGEVDACITNNWAREIHKLSFCSPTRPIQMLWSVFKRDSDERFPNFSSLLGGVTNEVRLGH